jgi:two-component system, sensor histidine kinase LadS
MTPLPSPNPWRSIWAHVAVALVTVAAVLGLYEALNRLTDQGSLPGVRLLRLTDDPATLTVEAVDRLPESTFQPSTEAVALGYTQAARWFRVEWPAGRTDPVVLVVQPSYLDDVQIHVPSPGRPGVWVLHQQGDHHAFALRERKLLSFAATVPPTAQGQRAYVRVHTHNAHNIRIRVLTEDTARTENALTLAFVGLYCGIVLSMAVASSLSAAIHRDRYWAANALFQLATMATMFFYFGLSNQFLFPNTPSVTDTLSVLCGFLQYFFGSLFYRLLYAIYGAPRWVLRLQTLSLLILPAQLVLMVFGRVDLALQTYGFSLPFTLMLSACTVYALRADDLPLLNLLRINMICTVVFFALLWATHLGLKPSGFMQLYPGVFINFITAIVLHLVLLRRGVLDAREQAHTRRRLDLSEQQVQFEQTQREKDNRFLAMLLHEMRSPLSVVNIALAALERKVPTPPDKDLGRIRQSALEMRDVLDQVQMSTELEHRWQAGQAWTPVEAGACDPQDHLKALIQTHPQYPRFQWQALADDQTRHLSEALLVPANSGMVGLMINNLLSNALKYAPPGATVQVYSGVTRAEPDAGPCWQLAVHNPEGPAGQPDPQRLFSKYYRAPKAHRISGTGLGLYVVHGMARMLGGDLQYQAQGRHVVFTLSLPLVPPGYDVRMADPAPSTLQ